MTSWRDQINNTIREPSGIAGLPNGQFPDSALYDVYDHTGQVIGRLCKVAANAWDAMVAAAWADGISLAATSTADTYRPLPIQQKIFGERYSLTDRDGTHAGRTCGGKYWFIHRGVATAACPGTSNHGRGLAVDVANASGPRLTWLEGHAKAFGFQWEIASESWHIHYMPGDLVPAAVQQHGSTLITPQPEDDDMKIIVPQGDGVPAGEKDVNHLVGNGKVVPFTDPRQLAGLTKLYGPQQFVDDLTWDVIKATGKAGG